MGVGSGNPDPMSRDVGFDVVGILEERATPDQLFRSP